MLVEEAIKMTATLKDSLWFAGSKMGLGVFRGWRRHLLSLERDIP